MNKLCTAIFLVGCFCCVPTFAESPLEACEDWAVKENVDAADRAEYVEDCVDELSASEADESLETEGADSDYPDGDEQYSEPGIESFDTPEEY